jgi:GDP-L-fucose synthase
MKVLVAGGTGLAGSAITRAFRAKGAEVTIVNRSTLNLLDIEATKNFLMNLKPSLVVDAAAKVGGIAANNLKPVAFLRDNLQIQSNLMSAAFFAEVEKFIFLGSSCVYPRDCNQPIKEESLMSGPLESTNSAYAVAKIAGIEMINSYRKEHGLNWISLMPTNLYGPGDNFNLAESHVFPALIRRFVEAEKSRAREITLWGTGAPLREFLHVDDLSSAVVMASNKYSEPLHLNVGTGQELSIKMLAELIAKKSGFEGEIKWDSTMPDGTPRKVLDISRITAMGWQPTITLEQGIDSTLKWFKEAVSRGEVRL